MQRFTQRATLPTQTGPDNVRTTPQAHQRTTRVDFKRVVTTGFGGQFLPIFAVPLLREDALRMTTFRLGFEMAETASMLLNPVRVAAHMWFVPKLAFERFEDLGQINRSYLGKPEKDNNVVPWFQLGTIEDGAASDPVFGEIARTMGLHSGPGATVNLDYIEAYNAIWNYVASQTSQSLTHRSEHDQTLAPAFWMHSAMRHVKPTFDQALIHGEVPLNVTESMMQVQGLVVEQNAAHSAATYYNPDGTTVTSPNGGWPSSVLSLGGSNKGSGFISPWVEMEENGITVSLANIDLARKTAAFARIRQQYQGLNDDQIIDLLMQGVRIPDEGLNYPLLLDRKETIFGMSQRYATDSGNLEKSVTRGQTLLDMRAAVPQTNTGGIVMCCVEILPEQLYERQFDPYMMSESVADLPDRMRDELDLEPVDIVYNAFVDVDHSDPLGVFGYAPLNHAWQREAPMLGGLYHRPRADAAWNENRNRIWAVETQDPALGDDFYLASNIHHEVFADSQTDPFEISASGVAMIEGLTFFGPALRESVNDYDKVMEKADLSRIDLPAPVAADADDEPEA